MHTKLAPKLLLPFLMFETRLTIIFWKRWANICREVIPVLESCRPVERRLSATQPRS